MEYNQHQMGSELVEGIAGLENVGTLLFEGLKESPVAELIPDEIKEMVEVVLATSFDDTKNLDLEKLLSAAIHIANETGVLPFKLSESTPAVIASVANEVFTRVKVNYQVGNGMIDLNEGTDILIDMAAARVVPILDSAIDERLPIVLETACMGLSAVFPPVGAIVPYVPIVANFLKEPAKQLVHKGVSLLQEGAKTLVRAATKKMVEAGLKVGRTLLSLI